MMVKIMSNSKRIKEKVHFHVSILAGAVHILNPVQECLPEKFSEMLRRMIVVSILNYNIQ